MPRHHFCQISTVRASHLSVESEGDLVAVTVAVELPGSEWCGVNRGSLVGPSTGADRSASRQPFSLQGVAVIGPTYYCACVAAPLLTGSYASKIRFGFCKHVQKYAEIFTHEQCSGCVSAALMKLAALQVSELLIMAHRNQSKGSLGSMRIY